MKLLLIEDDSDMAKAIVAGLKGSYLFDVAATGKKGLSLATMNDYDAIILDLGLPDMSGLEVCERLRSEKVCTPLLILTGQFADPEDKALGLNTGADDYLTKPFNLAELSARLRALLRRRAATTTNVVEVADITLDLDKRSVSRSGRPIKLKRKEFDLLEYLVTNPNRVLTRDMIYEHVWDSAANVFNNTVDVHIKYLRDKIDRPFPGERIKTVHGIGYKFEG